MASIRLLFSLLALPLIACGGGGEDTITPEGTHYAFVANKLSVPTNNNQAREYGLDLNNDKTVDNQLGMVLGTLAGQGFDVQGTIDKAIAEASIILLVDFQTASFDSTSAAGMQVKLGDMETPAACGAAEEYLCKLTNGMECDSTDPGCTCSGCGKHLTGGGTFTIDTNSPDNAAVAGKIVGGTFTGGPGDITLKIALGSAEGIELDLIGARAKATGISDTGITSVVIAGALSKSDLDTKVIPSIHTQIAKIITDGCKLPAQGDCGCPTGTGHTILGLFDTTPKNCEVTVDEIKNNTLIQSLLAPDVKINGVDALSLGIKATAVKGSFPTGP
jgi:hypothetical protein